MISQALLDRVACPVCLEPTGCRRCARPKGGHSGCAEYVSRVRCDCGGPDKVRLEPAGAETLRCPCCDSTYALRGQGGWLELAPVQQVGEQTRYAEPEFQEHLRMSTAPPLLSARVNADMMRRLLSAQKGERVLDLGCGTGRLAEYASRDRVRVTGVDAASRFQPGALEAVDLVVGDLRRLPFRKGAFTAAYCLDVLEHLDEGGVREVLTEARRSLGGSGRLFVYTHAMESSRLARFQRWVNSVARRLGERGLIDHQTEALRKSDHVNAIRSHEHFESLCGEAGLQVTRRRYYNVVFKAVIEDLLLRLYEHRQRRSVASSPKAPSDAEDPSPARPPGRSVLGLASGLTWLLKLDVVLFGGVRTGPFFALLRPTRPGHASVPEPTA